MPTTAVYKLPYPAAGASVSATPTQLLELNERIEAVLKARAEAAFETGDIKASVAAQGSGWLLCDGSAVSRATYSALFAKIGEIAGGGDGTTTFNVPDARNASWRGGGGNKGFRIGASGGVETVALTAAQTGIPTHAHTAESTGKKLLKVGGTNVKHFITIQSVVGASLATVTGSVAPRAAEEAHENMPPYFVGNYYIKT